MIVDAHQHFIRYRRADYPWITDETASLRRDWLPEQLAPLCAAAGVEATVAVQARQMREETDWLLGLARRNPLIAGVVGWVDLCRADVEGELERYADEPLLKGVRHVLHDEADDDFMLRPDFLRGIAALRRFGLVYDILIFARHLPQTLAFIRRFPDQPFVIDHIGKPDIAPGELQSWRAALRPVAACPNVTCKLSGLVTLAPQRTRNAVDFLPYIDTVLELFGPERTMVGSDWPVCTLAAGYGAVFAIAKQGISALSPAEREMVCAGTAKRVYRLSDRDTTADGPLR